MNNAVTPANIKNITMYDGCIRKLRSFVMIQGKHQHRFNVFSKWFLILIHAAKRNILL